MQRPQDAKLEGWLNTAVASPEMRTFLANVATDPMPGSSQKLAELLKVEVDKWRKLMEIAKLEPQ
jgi:tripartite-type tricarboxylate transporter receptor subunit TctC